MLQHTRKSLFLASKKSAIFVALFSGIVFSVSCGGSGRESLDRPVPPTLAPQETLPGNETSTTPMAVNIDSANSFLSTESILTEKGISLDAAVEVAAEDTYVFLPEPLPEYWALTNPQGRYAVVGFVAPSEGWGIYVTNYSSETNVMNVSITKPADNCVNSGNVEGHVAFLSLPTEAPVPSVSVEEKIIQC